MRISTRKLRGSRARLGARPSARTGARPFAFGGGALALGAACLLAGCQAPTESEEGARDEPAGSVVVENCGEDKELVSPARRILTTDASITMIALAVGGAENIAGVTTVTDRHLLESAYGEAAAGLDYITPDVASMETVLGASPDLVFSGWGYGLSDSTGVTPEALAKHDIDSYLLSDSCRGDEATILGTDPWDSLRTDLENIGRIVGHADQGKSAAADIDTRLGALRKAPQAATAPGVLVFDSASDGVFAPGGVGTPNAIVEAAGGKNVLDDVEERWTTASWESLAAHPADAIVFVDYPAYKLADKIAQLRENPATRDSPAVREGRFVNIPYGMWTEGPLNIDAAELVRKGLETYGLVPDSDIEPGMSVADLGVDGNDWAD